MSAKLVVGLILTAGILWLGSYSLPGAGRAQASSFQSAVPAYTQSAAAGSAQNESASPDKAQQQEDGMVAEGVYLAMVMTVFLVAIGMVWVTPRALARQVVDQRERMRRRR